MRVITAIEKYERNDNDICVFLAGGISNCPNWQKEVIDEIKGNELLDMLDNVVLFNPRRDNFPIYDPNATKEQIEWEFNALENADLFTMYFCNSDSVQPICLYELGRNIVRMQQKFKNPECHIIVSSEDGYNRIEDVRNQLELAIGKVGGKIGGATTHDHAMIIILTCIAINQFRMNGTE